MKGITRTKITEEVFDAAKLMLKRGNEQATISLALGISETSIKRIAQADNFATFDEQRKDRSSRIVREKPKAEQISVDDLMEKDDPLTRIYEAINRQTEVFERFMNMIAANGLAK